MSGVLEDNFHRKAAMHPAQILPPATECNLAVCDAPPCTGVQCGNGYVCVGDWCNQCSHTCVPIGGAPLNG